MGQHDLRHVRLQDSQDREGIARSLEHHPVVTAEALCEKLKLLRCARHPARRASLTAIRDRHPQKSRWTSKPIERIQPPRFWLTD
jgi:hypothetical protein